MNAVCHAVEPRSARRLLQAGGLFVLAALAGACAGQGVAAGPYPQFSEYEGREVRSVSFEGDIVIREDSLAAVTVTRPTRCRILFLPICIPPIGLGVDRYYLDLNELARDVARLHLYHRDHGYYGTQVTPLVDPRDDDRVNVRFRIRGGSLVFLEELAIEGVEDVVDPDVLRDRIPLETGAPFRRIDFIASADTIQTFLLRRGHAYADVLRNFAIDTVVNRATVHYDVEPGPVVAIDTVVVEGAERLGESAVRDQLTFREGDILRVTDLNVSQRNLYELGFVAFAAIQLAPEEMQRDPDRARATVLVRVVEAPRYLADVSAGYGTLDCLRSEARWLDRNFFGGGRRLDVSGSVSKIGVGAPLGWGLEDSLCPALREDPFSELLNYRLAAEIEQPRFFRPGTRVSAGIHTERVSEVHAFLRESAGVQANVVDRLTPNSVVTLTGEVERVRVEADPVVFCFGFEICTPEAWLPLQQFRWSNALSLTGVHDRTVRRGFTERGYRLRASTSWAAGWMGSDDRYLRLVGEGVGYTEVRPGWTLAGHVRAGTFLQGAVGPGDGYIPPDRRFYAGGPHTVRGFPRNALGPRAYVTMGTEIDGELVPILHPDSIEGKPVGGTEVVVASAELRTPSPVLGDDVRLGFFVDAGQVWAREATGGREAIRITPGAGVRVATPVGPIRVDVAYNPYPPQAGRLFMRVDDDIILYDPEFRPRLRDTFLSRLQFHIAVGHAY